MQVSADITKEQQNALTVLVGQLPNFQRLLPSATCLKKNGSLLPTNFMAASYEPIMKTAIPRETYWSWNQSNAKVSVKIDEQTTVTFRKISTKKHSSSQKCAPSSKIWLYEINSLWGLPQFFLWCEKGINSTNILKKKGVETEIGTIFPEELSAEALSFLRPFVEDDKLAAELGWA